MLLARFACHYTLITRRMTGTDGIGASKMKMFRRDADEAECNV